MNLSRRQFFKITGASAIVAAMPTIPVVAAVPKEVAAAQMSTLRLMNLLPGTRVLISDAATHETIANCTADDSGEMTVQQPVEYAREVVISTRHQDLLNLRAPAFFDGDLNMHLIQVRDEIVE